MSCSAAAERMRICIRCCWTWGVSNGVGRMASALDLAVSDEGFDTAGEVVGPEAAVSGVVLLRIPFPPELKADL